MNTSTTQQPTPVQKHKFQGFEYFQILFILLLVITPIIAIWTATIQKTIYDYKKNGIVVEATVGDTEITYFRRYTTYYTDVSFFTEGGVLDGRLVTTQVHDLMHKKVFESLNTKENVVYLKDDPEKKVVFEKSLQPENFSRVQSWNLTIYLLIATVLSFIVMRLLMKKQKTQE
jgi:hypothetical protein